MSPDTPTVISRNRKRAEASLPLFLRRSAGYSSLSLLKDLDADVVKLDRSFLFGLEGGDKLTAKLIANIVRMIGDLNRKVICEGVETKEHVDFLTGVGCYLAQGFLYDKPLRREIFEERLKDPVYKL